MLALVLALAVIPRSAITGITHHPLPHHPKQQPNPYNVPQHHRPILLQPAIKLSSIQQHQHHRQQYHMILRSRFHSLSPSSPPAPNRYSSIACQHPYYRSTGITFYPPLQHRGRNSNTTKNNSSIFLPRRRYCRLPQQWKPPKSQKPPLLWRRQEHCPEYRPQ